MTESILLTKSKAFALRIVRLYKYLRDRKESVIAKQLLRSGTSIGANIAESRYAQSKSDFASKLQIALKEAAETDDLHREYVLSQIRQQVGFTQADVAERLGVSQPTYAECERGSNMRIGTLQKIVTALGGELSFHVLIGGRDYNLQMPQPR